MADMKVRAGGSWVTPKGRWARINGQWLPWKAAWVRVNGAWVQFYTALSVFVQGGFNQTTGGGNNQYMDVGSFSVSRQPTTAPAPTSFVWNISDFGGQLGFFQGATGPNFSCRGPLYDPFAFNTTYQCEVSCTVTIEGKQYTTPPRTFNYTVSGAG